jgi:hypothetical protein
MSRNGSGTYTLPAGNPVVTGTTISTTWANNTLNDLAAAMTDSVAADGQTPMTGDLDINSNKIVNLAPATIAGEAVEYNQFVSATSSAVAITGGTINGTTIGETTRSSGKFTTLQANAATTLTSTLDVTGVATFTANSQFNGTGALKIPAGTTAQQPTPVTGQIRYNSTDNRFEGYAASSWVGFGSSAAGSNTQVQYNNSGVLAGSSAFTFDGTVLTIPKITFASSNTPSLTNYQGGALTSATSITASGTSVDFTNIPSWVKRITIIFSSISTNGASEVQVQLGTGATPTYTTSGYSAVSSSVALAGGTGGASSGSGFVIANANASSVRHGHMVLTPVSGNVWVSSHVIGDAGISFTAQGGGNVGLGAVLTAVRITTIGGSNSFDAGSFNIFYE